MLPRSANIDYLIQQFKFKTHDHLGAERCVRVWRRPIAARSVIVAHVLAAMAAFPFIWAIKGIGKHKQGNENGDSCGNNE